MSLLSQSLAGTVIDHPEFALGGVVSGAGAGTIEGALIQLDAQRSSTRATDENVPTALAGYRPRVTGTSSLTEQYLDNLTKTGTTPDPAALYNQFEGAAAVSSFGLTTTQTLFNGFQTANRTRQAEGQVFSAREVLRTTEQNTLLNFCRRPPSSNFSAAT